MRFPCPSFGYLAHSVKVGLYLYYTYIRPWIRLLIITTWGRLSDGGGSSHVQGQLRHVQKIKATSSVSAAVRSYGSVVTSGFEGCEGDRTAARYQMQDVRDIQATNSAFAALLGDGSVVSWGDPHGGEACWHVQRKLRHVQIKATSDVAKHSFQQFRKAMLLLRNC